MIDFGSIDFDLGDDNEAKTADAPVAEPVPAPAAAVSGDFDLEVPSLDFGKAEAVEVSAPESSSELEFVMPEADSVELGAADLAGAEDVSPYNAEMATKLDLAVAYQEIGDKEVRVNYLKRCYVVARKIK